MEPSEDAPKYARFSRRLQAAFVDAIVLVIWVAAIVALAVSTGNDTTSQLIVATGVLGFLLYEPILVWRRGGTIGHFRQNLRVTQANTNANIGFFAALLRFVIKTVLGWVSFISMLTTRRHQALHDVATHSIVQIRDAGAARSHHYVAENTVFSMAGMPSKARRATFVVLYGLLASALAVAIETVLIRLQLISFGCVRASLCTSSETTALSILAYGWTAAIVAIIYFGWRGRLPGCRRTNLTR